MAPEREIRVFVSSTFLDMQVERERLIKFVFPELRKICEARDVAWSEVDLRWGVTDEEREMGQVLPICLNVIHRCRPYFIGILGERYGWVPDELPASLLERETWLAPLRGRSVTELEILHGVLNNPEMADHAYFYFREPHYANVVPPEQQGIFRELTLDGQRNLADLKQRIRASKFPVRENFADAEALGDLVKSDLTALVDRLFPAGDAPDALEKEAALHRSFAQNRSQFVVARQADLARLDQHVASEDPPLAVTGAPGLGKSALLAAWAARYRSVHSSVFMLEHYVGASADSTNWQAMLRRIVGELNRGLGSFVEMPADADRLSDAEQLKSAFSGALAEAAARGRIVLLIDAVNQLEKQDDAPELNWVPTAIPANVRLIVSSAPGTTLNEITRRSWQTFEVAPLLPTERTEFIVRYLNHFSKTLEPRLVEKIAKAKQTDAPLYLRALIEELRVWGDASNLDNRIAYYLEAQNIPDLYQRILARYEEDYEHGRADLVGDSLSLIWCARRGLSVAELRDLLGEGGAPLAHAAWAAFELAIERSLISRSGLLSFGHEFLHQAVAARYLANGDRRLEVSRQLATYFAAQPLGPRQIDELPVQLGRLGAWDELFRLWGDLRFFDAAWVRSDYDVRISRAQIEANSANRVSHCYRSLIRRPMEFMGPKRVLWAVEALLAHTGANQDALYLLQHLTQMSRRTSTPVDPLEPVNVPALIDLVLSIDRQANILATAGELDKAMALNDEAESLARSGKIPSPIGKSHLQHVLYNRSIMLGMQDDLDGKLRLLREQEQICRRLGMKRGLQNSLTQQALIALQKADAQRGFQLVSEIEQVAHELGDRSALARSLMIRGRFMAESGTSTGNQRAIEAFEAQEKICRTIGDKNGLQEALGNRAAVLSRQNAFDAALALHQEE